jgi:hypothetical protein
MRASIAIAAAGTALLAACGGSNNSCPSTSANAENQNMASQCSAPAPQQVAIQLNLCEACSHTDPACVPDLHALSTKDIFLDTRWDVCTDNSSCATRACAIVTCGFSVPADVYQVHVIGKDGNPASFTLNTTSGAVCTGSI